MVREIVHDETFLVQKAEPAAPEDLPTAQDPQTFTGWTAQIVQPEIDHCKGAPI